MRVRGSGQVWLIHAHSLARYTYASPSEKGVQARRQCQKDGVRDVFKTVVRSATLVGNERVFAAASSHVLLKIVGSLFSFVMRSFWLGTTSMMRLLRDTLAALCLFKKAACWYKTFLMAFRTRVSQGASGRRLI